MRLAAAVALTLLAGSCGARAVAPPQRGAGQPPASATVPRNAAPPGLRTPPMVRVELTRAAAGARVQVKGEWTLMSAEGAAVRGGPALDAELALFAAGATLGGSAFPDDAELRPALDGDLRIDTTSGARSESRVYPGVLRVERGPGGRPRPMIALDVETYVAAVVNAEIPAAFPREAQRAQAVVARTYALTSTVRTSPDAPLVLADVGGVDQEFAGLAPVAEHRRIGLDAARSTEGVVLTDAGAPFVAYYHSTCGGVTCPGREVFGSAAADRALEGGVTCPWCTSSRYFSWSVTVPGADVVKAAGLVGPLQSFAVAETTAGGRAISFDVTAGGSSKRVRAAEFRLRVGPSALRSTMVDGAGVAAGGLVVRGRGWGHGVGLCQMGAKTLAERGLAAEAILAIYYPGAVPERRW